MKTTIIASDELSSNPNALQLLADALRAGQLVAFPTETVYGLGADATNPEAVRAIFAAKERPSTDPLIVHIAGVDDLPTVTGTTLSDLPAVALLLARRFWPGPLTLVLPRGPAIPPEVAAGLPTVGVRLPAHPLALALIRAAGVPIAAPSANRFGHTSPTTAQHVVADLDGRIPWVLDGGPTTIGIESTIVDMTTTPPTLLRPGGVAVEDLEAAIGSAITRRPRRAIATTEAANAPGQAVMHYAPRTPLVVVEGDEEETIWRRVIDEIATHTLRGLRVGAIVPQNDIDAARTAGAMVVVTWGDLHDDASAAQHLFAHLRALDDADVDVMVVGSFPESGLGLALRDRLWRAASGNVITVAAS